MSTAKIAASGIGLGLSLIEAALRVSSIMRQAHLEGRVMSAHEIAQLEAEVLAARQELENAEKP